MTNQVKSEMVEVNALLKIFLDGDKEAIIAHNTKHGGEMYFQGTNELAYTEAENDYVSLQLDVYDDLKTNFFHVKTKNEEYVFDDFNEAYARYKELVDDLPLELWENRTSMEMINEYLLFNGVDLVTEKKEEIAKHLNKSEDAETRYNEMICEVQSALGN